MLTFFLKGGYMNKFFSNIKKYHKYAIRSAKAELKSEVADSYLNWLWWIIEPVCFMLIYTFIFGYVFHNKTPYQPHGEGQRKADYQQPGFGQEGIHSEVYSVVGKILYVSL